MNSKPISALATSALLSLIILATGAQAQVYQWKDANGKTIFSDKPPPGKAVPMRQAPAVADDEAAPEAKPADKPAPKSLADRDLDFRKRQKESQEAAQKRSQEQKQSAELEENCSNARRYLQTLESGERIAQRDDKGERYYLDDTQREQEIAKTRQPLQNCR